MSSQATGSGEARKLPHTAVAPQLHHMALKTRRVDEMVDWYGKVTLMEVMIPFPFGTFLSNDEANHRLVFLAAEGEDADFFHYSDFHHVAFEYDSMQDLLANYARLRDIGITPAMTVDHGPTTSFYYRDPDDNEVELQCDNFGDWALSKDMVMNSPVFAANPLGTWVDPDQMIVAWEAGATADEIHERAYGGEFAPAKTPNLRMPAGSNVEEMLRHGYVDRKIPGVDA